VGTMTQSFRLPQFCVYSKEKIKKRFWRLKKAQGGESDGSDGSDGSRRADAGGDTGGPGARDFQTDSGPVGLNCLIVR